MGTFTLSSYMKTIVFTLQLPCHVASTPFIWISGVGKRNQGVIVFWLQHYCSHCVINNNLFLTFISSTHILNRDGWQEVVFKY